MITWVLCFIVAGAVGDTLRFIIQRAAFPKDPFTHCPKCGHSLPEHISGCNWKHPTKPKPPWGAIILTASCSLFYLFAFLMDYSSSVTPTPRPHATATSYRPPTITPQSQSCLLWSQITPQMQGQTVCIYGTVSSHRENWESFLTNIYFAGDFGVPAFFLVSTDRFSPLEGKCVTTTGRIQLNTYNTPYIKVSLNTLYLC